MLWLSFLKWKDSTEYAKYVLNSNRIMNANTRADFNAYSTVGDGDSVARSVILGIGSTFYSAVIALSTSARIAVVIEFDYFMVCMFFPLH